MPSVRSSYGRQGTRSGRRRRGRRGGSLSTRVRYQRPSARNQRSQIRSLARMAIRNSRILKNAQSYTDWFQNFNDLNVTGLWFAQELMAPADWTAGNRQDADVLVSQNVYLRNMVLEWYANSFTKNQSTQFEVFVVSIRNSASNWTPAVGPTGALSAGQDYTEMGSGNAVALNSGIFKVHYNKKFQLFPRDNPDAISEDVLDFSGNPFTTYRRSKTNIRLGFKVRSPAGLTWKNLGMRSLPPAQRMYLIYRGASADSVNQYQFSWGTHTTALAQS